ncbi:hypothetical protein ACQEVM_11260 [Streptomyces sp. CA-243310]|uniref:hypothetical protein n=1 Tax=Streptomyces sp. CA-243310 TaxID=3240056 RepID=UPI003D92EC10
MEIEGAQDIGVQSFHIQVKHRSGKYSPSRIAKAVRQMMQQFAADRSVKFALYCYFVDRLQGETLRLSEDELEAMLGEHSGKYDAETKEWFTKSFEVIFAPDFEAQFGTVLDHLKRVLRARSESEAMCWHAVIHGYLRDVIIKRPPGTRMISMKDLRDLVHHARAAVFEASYAQICGQAKYLRLLRDEYRAKSAHIPPRERLVIVECDDTTHSTDLVDIVECLQRRYYVGESPAPYVTFRGPVELTELKHALWRERIYFHDGFDYGGADFSALSIIEPPMPGYGIKLLDFARLGEIVNRVNMREVHDFYLTDPASNPFSEARTRHAVIEKPVELTEIFRGRS